MILLYYFPPIHDVTVSFDDMGRPKQMRTHCMSCTGSSGVVYAKTSFKKSDPSKIQTSAMSRLRSKKHQHIKRYHTASSSPADAAARAVPAQLQHLALAAAAVARLPAAQPPSQQLITTATPRSVELGCSAAVLACASPPLPAPAETLPLGPAAPGVAVLGCTRERHLRLQAAGPRLIRFGKGKSSTFKVRAANNRLVSLERHPDVRYVNHILTPKALQALQPVLVGIEETALSETVVSYLSDTDGECIAVVTQTRLVDTPSTWHGWRATDLCIFETTNGGRCFEIEVARKGYLVTVNFNSALTLHGNVHDPDSAPPGAKLVRLVPYTIAKQVRSPRNAILTSCTRHFIERAA